MFKTYLIFNKLNRIGHVISFSLKNIRRCQKKASYIQMQFRESFYKKWFFYERTREYSIILFRRVLYCWISYIEKPCCEIIVGYLICFRFVIVQTTKANWVISTHDCIKKLNSVAVKIVNLLTRSLKTD